MYNLVFIVHLAATILMTGLIWLVQVVHYPGFSLVGESHFKAYEAFHVTSITFVVLPLMLVEVATGGALLFLAGDKLLSGSSLMLVNLVLLGIIWASTFFLQVPIHSQLEVGFSQEAVARLVKTNWIRTIAWTFRSGILLFLVWKLIEKN